MKKIIIYQNPISYKSKDGSDISGLSEFIHTYLADGGDPRRVHKACPDLELDSEIILSLCLYTSIGEDIKPLTAEESEQRDLEDETKDESD